MSRPLLFQTSPLILATIPFCGCAEVGWADFIVTLNPKDFPQTLLSAHVIKPGEDVPTTARRKPRLRV